MNVFGNNKKKDEEPKTPDPKDIDVFLNYKSNLKVGGNISISTKNFERKNNQPKVKIIDKRKKNNKNTNRKLF